MCMNCVAMGVCGGQAKDWIPAPHPRRLSLAPFFPISCFPCSIFLFLPPLSLLLPTCCEVLHQLSVVAPNCASQPPSEPSKNTDWAPPLERIP